MQTLSLRMMSPLVFALSCAGIGCVAQTGAPPSESSNESKSKQTTGRWTEVRAISGLSYEFPVPPGTGAGSMIPVYFGQDNLKVISTDGLAQSWKENQCADCTGGNAWSYSGTYAAVAEARIQWASIHDCGIVYLTGPSPESPAGELDVDMAIQCQPSEASDNSCTKPVFAAPEPGPAQSSTDSKTATVLGVVRPDPELEDADAIQKKGVFLEFTITKPASNEKATSIAVDDLMVLRHSCDTL